MNSKDKRYAAGYAAGLAAGLAGLNPDGFSEAEMFAISTLRSAAAYDGSSWASYCHRLLNASLYTYEATFDDFSQPDETKYFEPGETAEEQRQRMIQRSLLLRYLAKYPLSGADTRC